MTEQAGFYLPTLAILGVGLIGGSLSLGLKQSKAVGHVIGFGRSQGSLDQALESGVINEINLDLADIACRADVIVLATPVGAMEEIFKALAPHLHPEVVITDVGSVKTGVVETARRLLAERIDQFVPGHPIAGKERSGVGAATADLFNHHRVAITPLPETKATANALIRNMWQAVGAVLVDMEVEQHDRVLSVTSHLPHVLAYAMVNYFSTSGDRDKCYEMAAGGFYDSTRIASSDPVMWRDICHMNRDQIMRSIRGYQETLNEITALIQSEQYQHLEALFSSAKAARGQVQERRNTPEP